MHRRGLLRAALVATGSLAFAGCLDGSEVNPSGENETGDGDTRVTGVSFEVERVECGRGENGATIALEDETEVEITGTIRGRNGCYRARLDESGTAIADGTLTVAVKSYDGSDGDRLCTECLTDIAYEARIETGGPGPETVVVEHDGEAVASWTV